MRSLVAAGMAVLIAGCSPVYRQFDGAVGFQALDRTPGAIRASYTIVASDDGQQAADYLRRGCAEILGVDEDSIKLDALAKSAGSVDVKLTFPVAAAEYGRTLYGGCGNYCAIGTQLVFHETHSLKQDIRRVEAACLVSARTP